MFNKIGSKRFTSVYYCIISLLLFCFILSLSSCMTTENYTLKNPKTIEDDGVIKIEEVIMKDSTTYKFQAGQAIYKKEYKNNKEVIVYKSDKIATDSITNKISREKYLLFLKDIAAVKYEKQYTFIPGVIITVMVVTALVVGLIWFLVLKDIRMG